MAASLYVPLHSRAALICMAAIATLMSAGCFTTAPVDNVNFRPIKQLEELTGSYENLGEPAKQMVYLSNLIWPDAEGLEHAEITQIIVRADADRLDVTATDARANIIRHDVFVAGHDFEIVDGIIQLKNRAIVPPDAESAAHFLGVGYEDVDIGLDEAGHGKYRSRGVVGGLFLMVIPIAAGGAEEVRFRRINE